MTKIIFQQTSSFGVRFLPLDRTVLEREVEIVKTSWGLVKIKIGILDGTIMQISPEYKDCKEISEKRNISVMEIYNEACSLGRKKFSK